MRLLTGRLRADDGSALITALLACVVMLALGFALLSIVDTQARESGNERIRDRAFNLSESVLTSEAFVLGRNWPSSAPPSNPACNASGAGFTDTIGATTPASAATARLRPNLNASHRPADGYAGATWQVNICDDVDGSTVWSDALLSNKTWDTNNMPDGSTGNKKVWVRAQSTVGTKTRVVVGLVQVRSTPALDPKFGLVAGGLTDDLGASINALSTNALGGVLGGLLGTKPTVAPDPTQPASPRTGVIGLRCGALDVQAVPASTCLAGTIGALGALPAVQTLLTGGRIQQFPSITTATPEAIAQLRSQAKQAPGQYIASVAAGAANCAITAPSSPETVVFIEKIGNGDQSCTVDVGAGMQYKALVIGSGRIVVRGNGSTTAAPLPSVAGPQVNTFSGVLYATNQQRLPTAEGGEDLGDAALPGREVIRIENGAHVKGGVYADGKSAKIGIYPPPVTIATNALVDALIPCTVVLFVTDCTLRNSVKLLGGVTAIVDRLIELVGLTATTNAILNQVNPQRAAYGSAITADVAAIKRITVYGASGVVPGTFRDLQARRPQ